MKVRLADKNRKVVVNWNKEEQKAYKEYKKANKDGNPKKFYACNPKYAK